MGNATSFEDLDVLGMCTGSGRKNEEGKTTWALPSVLASDDDHSSSAATSPVMKVHSKLTTSTPPPLDIATPMSHRKSIAELAEVGLRDDVLRQKYLNFASLDDALAEGLITPDDYAQKLKRMDSINNRKYFDGDVNMPRPDSVDDDDDLRALIDASLVPHKPQFDD